MKRVYLDYAAAAPVSKGAKRAFLRALSVYGNPSSAHEEGRRGKKLLEEARERIARMATAKKEHLTFTSGATEANTLALEGYAAKLLAGGRTPSSIQFFYHQGAHASVTHVMERLAGKGITVVPLPLIQGRIDIDALKKLVGEDTALISLEAISPETGMRHATRELRTMLDSASCTHTLIHVDASQLPLVESFERERLSADLLTLDAQKIGGVRGIGCLIRSARAELLPLYLGGGQERGLRSGTESPALAQAFAHALHEAQKEREKFAARSQRMRARLIQKIQEEIENVVVLGGAGAAPHLLTIALPSRDTDYLQALLDADGYAVGTKSACESDSVDGSRMAFAETGKNELAASTLRISWGPEVQEKTLLRFALALISRIRFLDKNKLY